MVNTKYIFSIPDSIMVRGLNFGLLDAMKEYKEWFYDDFIIESAYGCPATCIWNGGRNIDVFEKGFNENIIDLIFTVYESFGIKYRLIFTNSLLRKEHLENKVGNALAKMLDKRGGSVMVSTGMMANYMLRYHGLQINWSTTTNFGKNTDDIMIKINELTKKHLVVLPCELNNSPLIDQLENHGNIELLVNELCVDNCRKRREHWEITNKYILKNAMIETSCFYPNELSNGQKRKHNIDRNMLREVSLKGINKFKLAGRNNILQITDAYKHYFVKTSYQQDFQNFIDKSVVFGSLDKIIISIYTRKS